VVLFHSGSSRVLETTTFGMAIVPVGELALEHRPGTGEGLVGDPAHE